MVVVHHLDQQQGVHHRYGHRAAEEKDAFES
jgi:hypothetical protein